MWFWWAVRLPSGSRRNISRRLVCEIWRLRAAPPSRGWRSSRTSRAFPRSFWSKRMCYRGRRTLALVAKYSRADNARPLFFRPIRTAVAAYENRLHAPLNHAQVSSALHQLLERPPSDFDNRIYVDRALEQWNAEDPTAAVQMNVSRIEQLIPEIERKGSHVLLFELPCSAQLEGSRSAKITREIVHTAFPHPGQWLHIEYAREELRWADGVHLDERSAVIVAQSIDKALSSLPGSP